MWVRTTFLTITCSLCILVLLAQGQEKSSRLTFEVAAIRPAQPAERGGMKRRQSGNSCQAHSNPNLSNTAWPREMKPKD